MAGTPPRANAAAAITSAAKRATPRTSTPTNAKPSGTRAAAAKSIKASKKISRPSLVDGGSRGAASDAERHYALQQIRIFDPDVLRR